MVNATTMKRCQGCRYMFRAGPGETCCSQLCSAAVASAWVLAGLRKFAETHPPKVG